MPALNERYENELYNMGGEGEEQDAGTEQVIEKQSINGPQWPSL